jgi:hypothetical protein
MPAMVVFHRWFAASHGRTVGYVRMGPNVIYEGDTVCIRGGDGETAEGPQCVSHVDPINMGDTPAYRREHAVVSPALPAGMQKGLVQRAREA